MKHILAIITGVSLLSLTSGVLAAGSVETTKGTRLVPAAPATSSELSNLKKGDKLRIYCPMMKTTLYTVVRNVDSKGHVKLTETTGGLVGKKCRVVMKRDPDSKQVSSQMICPDGSVVPVTCEKM